MNKSQRWILPPVNSSGNLSVDTGTNQGVTLIFVNCGGTTGANESVVFEVQSVSYGILLNAAR